MNTKTIHELRAVAKQQGLMSYSRLKKAELITLLSSCDAPMSPLLNELVPHIQVVPITLAPTRIFNVYDKTKSTINPFVDWFINHVPEETKSCE